MGSSRPGYRAQVWAANPPLTLAAQGRHPATGWKGWPQHSAGQEEAVPGTRLCALGSSSPGPFIGFSNILVKTRCLRLNKPGLDGGSLPSKRDRKTQEHLGHAWQGRAVLGRAAEDTLGPS